jgi:hypothetical protein
MLKMCPLLCINNPHHHCDRVKELRLRVIEMQPLCSSFTLMRLSFQSLMNGKRLSIRNGEPTAFHDILQTFEANSGQGTACAGKRMLYGHSSKDARQARPGEWSKQDVTEVSGSSEDE